jgi:hypothetical protein
MEYPGALAGVEKVQDPGIISCAVLYETPSCLSGNASIYRAAKLVTLRPAQRELPGHSYGSVLEECRSTSRADLSLRALDGAK